jgi:hypothetical protein
MGQMPWIQHLTIQELMGQMQNIQHLTKQAIMRQLQWIQHRTCVSALAITVLGVRWVASDAETCCLLLKRIVDSALSFEKQRVVRQTLGSNSLILFLHGRFFPYIVNNEPNRGSLDGSKVFLRVYKLTSSRLQRKWKRASVHIELILTLPFERSYHDLPLASMVVRIIED